MNNDINKTLQALVPILQMNGGNVQSIEAVQNWYTINGTEYMKEVAEITYTSGYRKYADIGCDANMTAVYDVMAVIQDIKPRSECVGRIVRGVYEIPAVEPELKELSEWKADFKEYINALNMPKDDYDGIMEYIDEVPSAQPEIIRCKDCKYYKYGICMKIGANKSFHGFCDWAERGEQDE